MSPFTIYYYNNVHKRELWIIIESLHSTKIRRCTKHLKQNLDHNRKQLSIKQGLRLPRTHIEITELTLSINISSKLISVRKSYLQISIQHCYPHHLYPFSTFATRLSFNVSVQGELGNERWGLAEERQATRWRGSFSSQTCWSPRKIRETSIVCPST